PPRRDEADPEAAAPAVAAERCAKRRRSTELRPLDHELWGRRRRRSHRAARERRLLLPAAPQRSRSFASRRLLEVSHGIVVSVPIGWIFGYVRRPVREQPIDAVLVVLIEVFEPVELLLSVCGCVHGIDLL